MAAYDFSGWATKNNLRCTDGRTIRKNAFKEDDGKRVPLVWQHMHDGPENVLGHAILENREDGVYAYCSFNNTVKAMDAKELVRHGDITSLSIYANKLTQTKERDVLHGHIREVSLVLAGANPGAEIDVPVMAHGDDYIEVEDEIILKSHITEDFVLAHFDEEDSEDEEVAEEEAKEEPQEDDTVADEKVIEHADDSSKASDNSEKQPAGSGKTVGEILDTLNEEQETAVLAVIGQVIEDAKNGNLDDEEDEDVKHNVFDNEENYEGGEVLSHAEIQAVFEEAKRNGSLKDAVLAHGIDTTGMEVATGTSTYGFNDPEMVFPDYKSLNTPPEWIKRDTDWVSGFLGGVTKSPFTRIKSMFADITEDEARARGYIKGTEKVTEVFSLLKRTTDATTIYKLQKMDRDDIIDITDFDVIPWIKAEMNVMLDEELARACLIGDGRLVTDPYKVKEDCIRPIAKDVPLFNIQVQVNVSAGATGSEKAEAMIEQILRGRKKYKGSGNPTLFTTEDWLTEMLLLKDGIGHRLYKTVEELATSLRVSKIVTVEVMEGEKIDGRDLAGIIVNPKDYRLGNNRGGDKSLFDDFDIKFNQQLYLIETRRSGALVKPYSAMTITVGTATQQQAEG